MLEFTDTQQVKEEFSTNLETCTNLYQRIKRLNLLNTAGLAIPYIAISIAASNVFETVPTLLAAGALSAAVVQASRYLKARVRKDLNKAWEKANPTTREYGFGFIKEAVDTKIGHSENLVSKEDFKNIDKRNIFPIATTFASAVFYQPLIPLAYFTTSQMFEWSDSSKLEIATRHQIGALKHVLQI